MWETIKAMLLSLCSALIAYLDPVAGNLESLLGLFVANFVVGYVTGLLRQNESFEMKKFLMAFVWAVVILGLICFLYFLGERNGNSNETLDVVRWVSLIAIWAFGTNILRNLRHLAYGYGVYYVFFDALYTGVSLEFIKKIPFLRQVKSNKNVIRDENQ